MLLSSNDLKAIQAALDVGRELLLERRFGDICLRVTTAPAPPVWDTVKMLARLEIWRGQLYSTKWCISAEEVRTFEQNGAISTAQRER